MYSRLPPAKRGAPDPPAGRPSVSSGPSGGLVIAWSSPHYDGGAMITGYSIEMSQDSQIWTTIAHCSERLSETVRGLSPGSSYSFRVRSHNSHGPSEPGPPSHPFIVTHLNNVEEKREKVEIAPGGELETKYSILDEIGKGRYGLVRRALELESGEPRAAKYVRVLKRQDIEGVSNEVDIMNQLKHPLILRLIAAFHLPKDIVLILEYVSGGELFERVAADDFTLTERDCILFMRQICEAVAYIHGQGVVHLDLKPENIMCTSRSCHVIKIIDFGLAKHLSEDEELKVMLGTPEFIAPEIVNYEPVGFQSDMWSVGVIAYVLLSGLSPFMGDSDVETFANITRASFDYDDEAFDNISDDAKDFISKLLIKKRDKRLTGEECLRHRWLSQGDDTMSQVKLSTEKLKKFIIRRKWQKTGHAIRALGRMATLSRSRNASPSPQHRGGTGTAPSDQCHTSTTAGPVQHHQHRGPGATPERSDSGFSEVLSPSTSLRLSATVVKDQGILSEDEEKERIEGLKVREDLPPKSTSTVNSDLPAKDNLPSRLTNTNSDLPVKDDQPPRLTNTNSDLPVKDDKPLRSTFANSDLPVKDKQPLRSTSVNTDLPVKDDLPPRLTNISSDLPVKDELPPRLTNTNSDLPVKDKQPLRSTFVNTDLLAKDGLPPRLTNTNLDLPVKDELPHRLTNTNADLPVKNDMPPRSTFTSPDLRKKNETKIPGSENIQKAFAFWNR